MSHDDKSFLLGLGVGLGLGAVLFLAHYMHAQEKKKRRKFLGVF